MKNAGCATRGAGKGARFGGAISSGAILGIVALSVFLGSCGQRPDRGISTTAFSGAFVELGQTIPALAHLRIAYFEPVPGGAAHAHAGIIQESAEPFAIVDFGPRDELPHEIAIPSIFVVFSQPVVPLARLGEPMREDAGLFYINPPLAGTFRWYGTRLLSFEPDERPIPQQHYVITVSDRITSLGGRSLEGPRSFSFETERLSVLDWQIGPGARWVPRNNAHPEDARYLRLLFSHPVNLAEIANWIEIRADGRSWAFDLEHQPEPEGAARGRRGAILPGQRVLLRISETLPLNTRVEMELRAGARSEPGWLGSRQARTWAYSTLQPFRFSRADARAFTQPRARTAPTVPISLQFNQNVEPDGAERHFSVDGFPALSAENVQVFGGTVEIRGLPLRHEASYTVRISAALSDLHGRALGENRAVTVNVGAANSFVFVSNSGSRMLEAGFPARIVWEAQNPVSMRRLTRAAQNPYERIASDDLLPMDLSGLLPNAKNYFMEDLSPFLNAGGFGAAAMRWQSQIRSSWNPAQIWTQDNWLTVQVTNIGITTRFAYNMALVWATRLSDGAPIANAQVELMDSNSVILTGRTDGQGLAVFEFADGDFASRFRTPSEGLSTTLGTPVSIGFRMRVSYGEGDRIDRAEFVPNNSHNFWRFSLPAAVSPFAAEAERPVTLLFTDRGLYQPGETVTFRGIDRNLVRGVFEAYHGPYEIIVTSDMRQAPAIATLSGVTTANGGTYGSFVLPDSILPGRYRITYRRRLAGTNRMAETSIVFTVANFERLRFESSLHFSDPLVHQGERLSAELSASWLAGGGLSGAPFTWRLTREPARFVPGGSGGAWRNWNFGPELTGGRRFIGQGEGELDPGGRASISHYTSADGIEGATYSYRLEASVQDAARQEIASSTSILVHPASFYIAARLDSGTLRSAAGAGSAGAGAGAGADRFAAPNPSAQFISAGSPATVSWALVSPAGDAPEADALQSPGEISFQLVRHEWMQARQAGVAGRINLVWERVETVVEERTVRVPAAGAGAHASGVFSFTPDRSGMWEARLQSQDGRGRTAATRFRFFASGAGWVRWGAEDVDIITLTADRQSYAPGETAQILVRSPLERGKYLLTLEREGIISQQIIELDGSALIIDIPIEESFIPVVYVTLSSFTVRSGPPQGNYYEPDLDRPRGIFGVVPIFVDTESRNYQIEIAPNRSVFRPGEEAEVTIKVSLNGRPAPNTEVTFLAVDRGVVDLIDHRVPNPTAFFYNPRNFPIGSQGADSRSILIDPVLYNLSDLQGGGDGESRASAAALASARMKGEDGEDVREDFRPTAVFEPFLVTGADGTVTARFTLPDSLTTFRSTAVAVGLSTFGIQEHDIRVSAPLTALPALPRRLRWRDTGTVSLILTNLESAAVEASVSLEAETLFSVGAPPSRSNGGDYTEIAILEVDGASSQTLSIPPGASREVSFRVAALGAGQARLAFTLRSPQVNERILRTLDIERPVLTESVATIGSLGADDAFIEEGMVLPSLVPEGTGNVMVTLSASRLAVMREAVGFLMRAPFDNLENRTARLLPALIFGDDLEAFWLEPPAGAPIAWDRAAIAREIEALARYQLADGSFPLWPGGRNGNVFVSLRVAHIAAMARARGIELPADLDVRRLIAFLTSVGNDPRHWAQRDPFLLGYSLWVRAMHRESVVAEITAFLQRGDELGISGWAFAGLAAMELGQPALANSARDRVRRFLRPGARTVDLTDTFERRGNFWGFDTDRFALALMLFHALAPDDDMTTRLASSLIERQRGGIWGSTVSSFWAVLAFGAINEAEAAEWRAGGTLEASATLGGISLLDARFGSHADPPAAFNGAFAESPVAEIPRDALLPLRIERSGPGRLYYTAILRYGIPVELAGARDEGLSVFAETFDSAGRRVTDGRLRAGATYTRRVTISTSRDRTHIALRSPIPSGAEIVDAAFVTSPTAPPAEGEALHGSELWDRDFWQAPPVRFIMDNEARFHWDFFRAGRQQVEFRFRAVMPGIYPTPPASAEGMFEEEVFGRSAGELVRIE